MIIKDIISKARLPFRKDRKLYCSIKNVLGFYPNDITPYKLALMHRSLKKKEKGKPLNNERLEFLGDAILSAVVGDVVYKHFPGKKEGFLTTTRSKIVQRETLNRLAKEIGLTKLIMTSDNQRTHNNYMGGNAFEAIVGAIYLDKGYSYCKKFIEKKILKTLINVDKTAYKEVNFKSKLIEWCQKNRIVFNFILTEEHKENGSPVFTSQVILENIECECGSGYSKKESQQVAAKKTLKKLNKNPLLLDELFEAKSQRTKMEEQPIQIISDVCNDEIEVHEVEISDNNKEKEQITDKEEIIKVAEQAAYN